MTKRQERAKLAKMSLGDLVVYWNCLQFFTKTLNIDPDNKVERHQGIVKSLLSERGINAVPGRRLKAA